jgi:hypothetical protein
MQYTSVMYYITLCTSLYIGTCEAADKTYTQEEYIAANALVQLKRTAYVTSKPRIILHPQFMQPWAERHIIMPSYKPNKRHKKS